jgi:micrococcal nuclease
MPRWVSPQKRRWKQSFYARSSYSRRRGPDSTVTAVWSPRLLWGRDAENWVQYEILTKGYALVGAGGDNATCVTFLRGVERRARANGLGLWGDPYFVMKEAQYPDDDVLTELGRFVLVSGKVISVNESGGLVYLNFGRRWTESFTVTVAKRNQRAFTAAGLDPKKLTGRQIEVRGFIEERGGPAIEASRPEQIEIVASETVAPK